MGMAATQANIFGLLTRKSSVSGSLNQLSNDKIRLSNDVLKLTREYQSNLNKKVLKWSNNSGVTYSDLDYSSMMKPSALNEYKPYLITDLNDRVIVDAQMKKYAAMISPNGNTGGDWDSVRSQVLAEILGIDESKINLTTENQELISDYQQQLSQLRSTEPRKPVNTTQVDQILQKLGNNFDDSYNNDKSFLLHSGITQDKEAGKALVEANMDIFKELAKYFSDPEAFEKACDEYLETILDQIEGTDYSTTPFLLTYKEFVDGFFGFYSSTHGDEVSEGNFGNPMITWSDVDSDAYAQWEEKHTVWQAEYDEIKGAYDNLVSSDNMLFTAEEEKMISFYDQLFSSIAEKGWSFNDQVNDTEYLNLMMQNNMFMITEVKQGTETDYLTGKDSKFNIYDTNIASNMTNIFSVKDTDAIKDAELEYTNKKTILQTKETRIDNRMQKLDTELSAINTMLQSLESVVKDNSTRAYKTFVG